MNIKTEKVEESPEKLGAVPPQPASSGATPARAPTPASATSAQVKIEPVQSPVPATPANKPLSISIPPSTNGIAMPSSTNAAAPSLSETPAVPFSTLAHIFSNSVHTPAISPLSDVGPAIKRSRTPEAGEENGAEKRQKTEHIVEQQDQDIQDVGSQIETDVEDNPFAGWDLGAQLSNILGSVEPEPSNNANAPADNSRMDILQSIPLPPPRQRLEKMKFIENPTYFSRAMGLPTLGSLVSWASNSSRSKAFLTCHCSPCKYYSRSFSSLRKSQTDKFETCGQKVVKCTRLCAKPSWRS